MKTLFLRDVGGGLHLSITDNSHSVLTVDFGGSKNLKHFCCLEGSFMLTHFHRDHYSGFLDCKFDFWNLDKFYHPAMPSFENDKKFYTALLAINIRVSNKHPLQNTIMSLIAQKNRSGNLQFIPVSKGDSFICGDSKYEILWPPKELKEDETKAAIKTAIKKFEEAMESDERLKEIYTDIYQNYQDKEINIADNKKTRGELPLTQFEDELSEIVQDANNSLRKAANRLSIAFRQDDNVLFLGDLEEEEIAIVVNELKEQKNEYYEILISAHHGTHWHDSLYKIKCDICLASLGGKTLRDCINYNYTKISNKFVRTDEWGDIRVASKQKIY